VINFALSVPGASLPGMSVIPRGRAFTVDDLETMPDDGNRYELVDGSLHVSPAPGRRHQRGLLKLAVVLEESCPAGMEVLPAPFAVRGAQGTQVLPDLLVAREEDLTDYLLPVAPVLAVEVLSPSTVLNDLNNKKAVYERMGVPSYWVVDPQQPGITVFELVDGKYDQVAEVKDGDVLEVARPFAVRVAPRELLGTLA
jgi:Uma2 family endonuclease